MNLSLCNYGGVTCQLLPRYSLKFTCCLLLVVKSVAARCKLRSLLVAEIACCKNSPVTRCRSCMLRKFTRYSLQKLLVAKNHSLLVAEVARCKKSLVTHCEIRLILVATNHFLLNAKNHSSLVKTITSP